MTIERERFEGSCLCGTITFEVTPPTRWCAHCHCTKCQRAHGAAFVTWFGVPLAQFRVVSGEDTLRWYQSSEKAQRGFCGRCGSTLFFRGERWADEMHIALANMREGTIDRQPTAHVFFDTHAAWLNLGDGLKRLGGPTGTEPLSGP